MYFFSGAWRHKYFQVLDHIVDELYVVVAPKFNKFATIWMSFSKITYTISASWKSGNVKNYF